MTSDLHDMTFKHPNDGDDQGSFGDHQAIIQGLLMESATIAPKYFYDDLGCRLFEGCGLGQNAPPSLRDSAPRRTPQSQNRRFAAAALPIQFPATI